MGLVQSLPRFTTRQFYKSRKTKHLQSARKNFTPALKSNRFCAIIKTVVCRNIVYELKLKISCNGGL